MGKTMRFFMISAAFTLALGMQGTAFAQGTDAEVAVEPPQQDSAPAEAEASDSDQSSDGVAQDTLLSEAELEQLVAPVALYSDPLLANVLIASTYPLEVVQAERWYQKNKELKGDGLQEALAKQDWDDSIKDLVTVPDALEMMNKDLDWTQNLGDAVLAQQADVMEAVQALRARANENGMLESNPQQTVTVTQTVVQNGDGSSDEGATSSQGAQPTQEVIAIQPTDPERIYVPYYEPSVAYGAWPYPSYQPYYFPPPPGYALGSALATGLVWSAGFAVGNAIWGNGFNWGRNDINVNVNRNISGNTINRNNINAQKWEHNSAHRRGVQYNNTNVQNKFSKKQANLGDRRPGGGEGRPGGGNLGDRRPGGGEGRPGGGNLGDKRPGGRPSVGDIEAGLKKPGGGNRPAAGGGNRPNAGTGGRPGGKDRQANLKDRAPAKKPAAKRPAAKKPAAKKPAAKRPAAKKPAAKKSAAKKPAAKKPASRKPQSRPSGNAFKKHSGGGARKASSRGRASAGGRSVSRGGGGGRRAGGGGRGGGRRR